MTARSGHVPGTIRSRRSRLLVGIALALPTFLLAGLLLPGAVTAGDGPIFESEVATLPPGGTISTRDAGGPDAADPFDVALKNVGNETLTVRIAEESCTFPENAALCSGPRVGGRVGNFTFPFVDDSELRASHTARPVVVVKLFYDKSLLHGVRGFKIYWQKPGGPVRLLPPCDRYDHGDDDRNSDRRTECFSGKKRANGDEVVRIPLSFDPKFTRG